MGKLRIDEMAAPGAGGIGGLQDIYIDSTSHKLSMVNSAAAIVVFQTAVIAATGGLNDTPNVAGIAGAVGTLSDAGHTHRTPGGIAQVADGTAVNNTTSETRLIGVTVPSGFFVAGTSYRIKVRCTTGTFSSVGIWTFRVRVGATTLTGTVLASIDFTPTVSLTGKFLELEATIIMKASATTARAVISEMDYLGVAGAQQFHQDIATAAGAITPGQNNEVELTLLMATTANTANTVQVLNGTIEAVNL